MINRRKVIEAFSGNAVRVAYGMIMMTFITRQFPIEETGAYFLVVAIMTLLSDWKEGFFLSGFIKYIVEEKGNPKIISTGLILSLAWDLCNIGLFLIAVLWLPQLADFVSAYIVMIVLSSLSKWVTYIHRSHTATDILFQSNIVSLGSVLLGIGAIYWGALPIAYCLMVLGISNFLPCILLRRNLSIILQTLGHLQFDRESYQKLRYFGKYGVLLALTGAFLINRASSCLPSFGLDCHSATRTGKPIRHAAEHPRQ